jgi:hypothetical protein
VKAGLEGEAGELLQPATTADNATNVNTSRQARLSLTDTPGNKGQTPDYPTNGGHHGPEIAQSGYTSMSFTTKSESVPLVEASRLGQIAPVHPG